MKIVHGKKWYKPIEIARLRLIQNSNGDQATESSIYVFVHNLIKTGQLKARNYSVGAVRQHYLVSEDEIEKYNRSWGK